MAEFMIDEIKNFIVYFKRCPICNQLNAVGLKKCIKCDTSLIKQYWDSEEKFVCLMWRKKWGFPM